MFTYDRFVSSHMSERKIKTRENTEVNKRFDWFHGKIERKENLEIFRKIREIRKGKPANVKYYNPFEKLVKILEEVYNSINFTNKNHKQFLICRYFQGKSIKTFELPKWTICAFHTRTTDIIVTNGSSGFVHTRKGHGKGPKLGFEGIFQCKSDICHGSHQFIHVSSRKFRKSLLLFWSWSRTRVSVRVWSQNVTKNAKIRIFVICLQHRYFWTVLDVFDHVLRIEDSVNQKSEGFMTKFLECRNFGSN